MSDSEPSWWERWPGLYERELQAFADRGVQPVEIYKAHSVLILEVDWPTGDDRLKLRIGFSPLHPFCRVSVAAPEQAYKRHQNPIARTLCLIPDEPGQWNSSELVADFLENRVNHFLKTLKAHEEGRWEEVRLLEEHAPDPLMPYFQWGAEEGSVVLFDGNSRLPRASAGLARLTIRDQPHRENPAAFEAVLHALEDSGGPNLRRFNLPSSAGAGRAALARWVKARPPATENAEELLKAAEAAIRGATALNPAAIRKLASATKAPLITIFVFPDETTYGDANSGVGMVFLVTRGAHSRLVRGEGVSDAIFARSPAAAILRTKHVLVVGCGAIGSFVASELARGGVGTLAFWDGDYVSPGNSVRWALGRPAWGQSKVHALMRFLQQHYPHCQLQALKGRVGGASTDPTSLERDPQNPLQVLHEAIAAADVVIDATGSTEVQQALSFLCRDLGRAYVVGYGTLGVAGGMVGSFPPQSDGCFICLSKSWRSGDLPALAEDAAGTITPGGCNSITFTGASFDLQEISLQMVRTAVELLSGDAPQQATVATLKLRDADGRRLPAWRLDPITPHAACPAHQ